MSKSFLPDFCSCSSTEPIDERDVDEAEAVGESFGVLALLFLLVEGAESAVTVRLMAA